MFAQRTTLYSKASYQDPSDVAQAIAETKCYYLYSQLKKLSEQFESVYGNTRQNPIAVKLKRFNQLLITRTRTTAIIAGEKFVADARGLFSTRSADTIRALLLEMDDDSNITASHFHLKTSHTAAYEQQRFALERKVNLPYNRDNYNEFSTLIYQLSECKSFLILRKFLGKQAQAVLINLRHLLHYAFYQAIHFGDEVMVEYLLNHGVDANDIYRKNSMSKIMPLTLVLDDLECCTKRMEAALQAACKGDYTLGTTDELQALFATRLRSYKIMLVTLLDKGADADKEPQLPYHQHQQTPRERALTLAQRIKHLEDSDFLIKEFAEPLMKVVDKVGDAADINDFEPAAAGAEPVEKKLKPNH